jgi:hypothetical protein
VQALRQLNLQTRLFEHPLSYFLFSEQFSTLPAYTKDYVYQQLATILTSKKSNDNFSHISSEQRLALLQLLNANPNALTPYLASTSLAR